MDRFWDKVMACEHKRLSPDYLVPIPCGTPYCDGYESHCLDCGAYISECGCGANNGISGWPHKRHYAESRKQQRRHNGQGN